MAFRSRGKTKKKQRFVPDSDEDGEDIDAKLKSVNEKAQTKQAPRASKLSFGDDVDDSNTVYKKKKKKSKSRGISTTALDESAADQAGGNYTSASLAELKLSTPQMPQRFSQNQTDNLANDGGPEVLKISGSFRASGASASSRASAMPQPLDPSMPLPPPSQCKPPPSSARIASSAPEDTSAPSRPAGSAETREATGHDGEEDIDDDDSIPNAELIKLAKAKRLRLRDAHIAPGYVPSDHPDFRSVRDYKKADEAIRKGSDDEGSEGDDDDDIRTQFIAGTAREKPEPRGPIDPAGPHHSHSDASDPEDGFTATQVRRALGPAARPASRPSSARGTGEGRTADLRGSSASGHSVAERGCAALGAVEGLVVRLRERKARTEAALSRTRSQLATSLQAVGSHEGRFAAVGERYHFLQRFRAYLRDLCACLAHKAADVEVLEEERFAAMQEHCVSRRASRLQMLEELLSPAAAAVEALERREDPEAAAAAAEASALSAALPPALDEFGRDENAYARDRANARAVARSSAFADYAAAATRDRSGGAFLDEPALLRAAGHAAPGDDAETTAYFARRNRELGEVATGVLSDVAPEFASLTSVLERLKAFKAQYGAHYARAYVSETLPALLSLYVRLQLLMWDPLYNRGLDTAAPPFEEHAWFSDLFEFSCTVDDDPDTDLVPAVVAQIVAKNCFCTMLQDSWDAGDPSTSVAVKATVSSLMTFVTPETQTHFYAVIDAVKRGLTQAVSACEVPCWSPVAVRATVRIAAAVAAAWSRAVQLLASVCTFQGLLSKDLLSELAGVQLLSRRLLPAVTLCVEHAERGSAFAARLAASRLAALTTALPVAWRQGGGHGDEGMLELKRLAPRALRCISDTAPAQARQDAKAIQDALRL